MLSAEVLADLGVGPLSRAGAEVLAVPDALAPLFPGGGVRRGSTVTVGAGGSTVAVGAGGSSSVVLALVAAASRREWCAEVGSPLLGSRAAAEAGVVLARFVRVAEPGEQWASVVAGLLEAFTLVVVHPPAWAGAADMRRLSTRARERGGVLLATGPWEGAGLGLTITRQRWLGLGQGHGYLGSRTIEVRALGRGAAARPQVVQVWLPGVGGSMTPARESVA